MCAEYLVRLLGGHFDGSHVACEPCLSKKSFFFFFGSCFPGVFPQTTCVAGPATACAAADADVSAAATTVATVPTTDARGPAGPLGDGAVAATGGQAVLGCEGEGLSAEQPGEQGTVVHFLSDEGDVELRPQSS